MCIPLSGSIECWVILSLSQLLAGVIDMNLGSTATLSPQATTDPYRALTYCPTTHAVRPAASTDGMYRPAVHGAYIWSYFLIGPKSPCIRSLFHMVGTIWTID